jgi:hypothetical protein
MVIKIPSHSSQNVNHQENKQQILEILWDKGTLYDVGENVNECSPYGNQYGGPSKLNRELP